MEKIREVTVNNGFVKYYKYDKIVNPVEFLEELIEKGIPVDKIFMKRDAEMDMQFDIGEYTLEELKKAAKALAYGPTCKFLLKTEFNSIPVEINFKDDSKVIYMITPDPSIELDSLYEKKNNGLGL